MTTFASIDKQIREATLLDLPLKSIELTIDEYRELEITNAELLKALQVWDTAYQCGELDKYDDAWKLARAAIAKATGEMT